MSKEQVDIEFNIKDQGFAKVIGRLQEMSDQMGSVQTELKGMSKAGRGSADELRRQMDNLLKTNKKAINDLDFGHMFKGAKKSIEEVEGKIEGLGKAAKKVQEKRDAYEKNKNDENLKALQKYQNAYEETFNTINKMNEKVAKNIQSQSKEAKKVFVDDRKELNKYFEKEMPNKLGTGLGNSIKSALGGDLQGVVGGLTESVGGVAKGGLGSWRQSRKEKGLKNKMKGKGPGKMGGAVKALGKVARVLGPLMAAVGGIAMLVKLLMDAEAQTKELNKELTGTVSLYKLGGGSLSKSVERMEALRESATDFSTNLRLGLDPKQHYAVIGALEEHDASLQQLRSNYDSWGEMATGVVTDVRFTAQNLGTSMQEVAGFMGDLQSIHAMTLPRIQKNFTLITEKAKESGMSTKKFFSAVSQVAGQMDLYNFKLEDTVTLMSDFSKYMDPKNAKEFATALTTGFKEKGPLDRLKSMLLATGGDFQEMGKMVSASVKDMIDSMDPKMMKFAKDKLGAGSTEELIKKFQGMSAKEISQLRGQVSEEFGGKAGAKFQDAIEASRKSGRGALSQVDAVKHMGPIGQLSLKLKQLEEARQAEGANSIMDLTDTVAEKYAQIDQKEFANLKNVYGKMLKDVDADGGPEAIEQMIAKFREMSDESLEDLGLKKSTQETVAEQQVSATTSVANILQYMIYDILNTIGGHTSGIYRWIAKRFGSDKDAGFAAVSAEVGKARANLSSLKKQQQEETDPEKKKKLEKQIAVAQKKYDDTRKRAQNYRNNSSKLFDEEGNERSDYSKTLKQVAELSDHQRDYGYEGNLEDYQKLKSGIKSDVNKNYGSVSYEDGAPVHRIGGEKVSKEEFESKRKRREEDILREHMEEAKTTRKIEEKRAEIEEKMNEHMEKGKMNSDQMKFHLGNIARKDGIDVSSKAFKGFEEAFVDANLTAQLASELSEGGLFGSEMATSLAKSIRAGDSAEGIKDWVSRGGTLSTKEQLSGKQGPTLSKKQMDRIRAVKSREDMQIVSTEETQDAKFLTGGIAPLNFKPGDMVVDSASLSKAVKGKSGQFLPDLLGATGAGSKGKSGMNMYNTFNINGGNPQEVENAILKALDAAERKRSGES